MNQASTDEDENLGSDRFGRWTKLVILRWTNGPIFLSWTVHLMDEFGRWTIKNIKMWTEVDGWKDGRKSVRRGLHMTKV